MMVVVQDYFSRAQNLLLVIVFRLFASVAGKWIPYSLLL